MFRERFVSEPKQCKVVHIISHGRSIILLELLLADISRRRLRIRHAPMFDDHMRVPRRPMAADQMHPLTHGANNETLPDNRENEMMLYCLDTVFYMLPLFLLVNVSLPCVIIC